jgi:putative spermidine/putrescine transport system permease protein
MATTEAPRGSIRRRSSSFFFRHPKTRRGLTLAAPLTWMLVVYLASLLLLLANAFWRVDSLTSTVVRDWGWRNFDTVFSGNWRTAFLERTYYLISLHTVAMAALVTIADVVFAFPIAFFAARVASPRARSAIMIAVVIPLWANYLVRVFAWKAMLEGGGPAEAFLHAIGLTDVSLTGTTLAMWFTYCYLWLPYAILPIYASLERVPDSLIDASGDLGAHTGTTFRRVVLPLAIPGIVAGSIFTFSLTLGDYIAPGLITSEQFIGTVIYSIRGQALPLAAAYTFVPIAVMIVYLVVARRLGAFENL